MSSSDPSNSHPNNMAQPPPPPLPPPMTLSRSKDRTIGSHRTDRIQRSLESMTSRHTREDVQQLIFRYLQQSGYLRSAMSFAYECMASSVGQSPHRRGWSPRHPLSASTNTTEYRPFLHSGPSFSKLMQQQMLEAAAASENKNDTKKQDSLFKENWEQILEDPGMDEMAAADSIVSIFSNRRNRNAIFATPYLRADIESTPASIAIMAQAKHPNNRRVHRGSSSLGTILLLLVIYALLRLGSMK